MSVSKKPEYQLTKALLAENKKGGWRLDNGLAIGFIPAVENDGCFRLTYSRKRPFTDDEVNELHLVLLAVLQNRGTIVDSNQPIQPKVDQDGEHHLVRFCWRVKVVNL